LQLPSELAWSLHRGETSPIVGWYSAEFGLREPSFVLVGRGIIGAEKLRSFLTITRQRVTFQKDQEITYGSPDARPVTG
jgi:hypothetical protein